MITSLPALTSQPTSSASQPSQPHLEPPALPVDQQAHPILTTMRARLSTEGAGRHGLRCVGSRHGGANLCSTRDDIARRDAKLGGGCLGRALKYERCPAPPTLVFRTQKMVPTLASCFASGDHVEGMPPA